MAFAKDRTTAVFFISDMPGKTLMIQSRFGEKDRLSPVLLQAIPET